ncbi:MAG: hypothetical protein IIB60_02255, partial [Planctomycetes bacterium]|nr:hypothetical protein [Planctomycetota bacterium]
MPSTTSPRRSRRFIWRSAGTWMVVFAVGLAAVAITLALLQATSLTDRLMVQAERRAAKIAAQARQEFEKQTSHTLRLMATQHRRHPDDLWEPVPQTPSWMDGLY